jgi:hypothetical protein
MAIYIMNYKYTISKTLLAIFFAISYWSASSTYASGNANKPLTGEYSLSVNNAQKSQTDGVSIYISQSSVPDIIEDKSDNNKNPTKQQLRRDDSSATGERIDELKSHISDLKNISRSQAQAIHNLQIEISSLTNPKESNGMTFAVWTGILLAAVAVIVTTLAVITAVFSFFGYKQILSNTEKIATNKASEKATGIATEIATNTATAIATDIATSAATEIATNIATDIATTTATEIATNIATDIATDTTSRIATDISTAIATDISTAIATDIATDISTAIATDIATDIAPKAAKEMVIQQIDEGNFDSVIEAAVDKVAFGNILNNKTDELEYQENDAIESEYTDEGKDEDELEYQDNDILDYQEDNVDND